MTRTRDFEEVKDLLNKKDITLEQALELAHELVAHVEYWQRSERSATNFLVRKLKESTAQPEKSE